MSINSAGDIGSFDEESCRFFLREVGARVVPFYPFAFGMEEVYSLILEQYGYGGFPDATSVLQELLEDQESATGFGDDGDIWRSWRYSWRHRNDDPLKPFRPSIGAAVLEYPTTARLRRLKAANFLLKRTTSEGNVEQLTAKSSPATTPDSSDKARTQLHQPSDVGDSSRQLPSIGTTFSHQRCRFKVVEDARLRNNVPGLILQEPTDNSTQSSHSSQSNVRRSSKVRIKCDFDPTLLLPFQLIEPTHTSSESAATLHPQHEASLAERSGYTSEHINSDPDRIERDDAHRLKLLQYRIQDPRCSVMEGTPQSSHDIIEDNFSPRRNPSSTDNWHRSAVYSSIVPEDENMPSVIGTSASINSHRYAKLIDGAIFTPGYRRNSILTIGGPSKASASAIVPVSFTVRSSSVWQNPRQRRSWTHSLRSMFHAGLYDKEQNVHLSYAQNGTQSENPSGSCLHRRTRSTNFAMGPRIRPNDRALQLDGAADRSPSPNPTPVCINKALPCTPDDIMRGWATRSPSPFLPRSTSSQSRPPTASTNSTNITQASSKQDFQNIARHLVWPYEVHEDNFVAAEINLDPHKHRVAKLNQPQHSPQSFSSIAVRNPFTEDPVPLTPTFSTSTRPNSPGETFAFCAHLAQLRKSRSPDMQPFAQGLSCGGSDQQKTHHHYGEASQSPPKTTQTTYEMRGRSVDRENGAEKQVGSPRFGRKSPQRSQKRSRSPVKRLLGIGKSTSAPDIVSDDIATASRPLQIPERGTKSSLKKLGDKIRHGFLTADLEEYEREAQMENYHAGALSLPSTMTIPISLDPPQQSKVLSEMELMLCVTADRYLAQELNAGRISVESTVKFRKIWELKNRPPVVGFLYDQATQRDIVMANLKTTRFYGGNANDLLQQNAILLAWGTMARELPVRVFCLPDSVIKKHLHDAGRILELLGAPSVIVLAFQDMQIKTLQKMSDKQRELLQAKSVTPQQTRNVSTAPTSHSTHQRSFSDTSQDIPRMPRLTEAMKQALQNPASTPNANLRSGAGARALAVGSPQRGQKYQFEQSPTRDYHRH